LCFACHEICQRTECSQISPAAQRQGDSIRPARLDFAPWPGQDSRMNDEILQRLERVETNTAHLEHQVEQLNGVVIEQGRLVDHLKKQVQRMSGVLETMELERIKNNNPAPPHY
jgi:SlyX protein